MVRIKYLYQEANAVDFTYDVNKDLIWTFLEINMAIICASLPTLRPLAAIVRPKLSTAFSSIKHYSWSHSQRSNSNSSTRQLHHKESGEAGFANDRLCAGCKRNMADLSHPTLSQTTHGSDDSELKESAPGQIKVTTDLDQHVANEHQRLADVEAQHNEKYNV